MTFPDPIDSQVSLQCCVHTARLSRLPSQLPSRYKFLYFSPPTEAIKFPQFSCLAHWACSVGASQKEGVPVLQYPAWGKVGILSVNSLPNKET